MKCLVQMELIILEAAETFLSSKGLSSPVSYGFQANQCHTLEPHQQFM